MPGFASATTVRSAGAALVTGRRAGIGASGRFGRGAMPDDAASGAAVTAATATEGTASASGAAEIAPAGGGDTRPAEAGSAATDPQRPRGAQSPQPTRLPWCAPRRKRRARPLPRGRRRSTPAPPSDARCSVLAPRLALWLRPPRARSLWSAARELAAAEAMSAGHGDLGLSRYARLTPDPPRTQMREALPRTRRGSSSEPRDPWRPPEARRLPVREARPLADGSTAPPGRQRSLPIVPGSPVHREGGIRTTSRVTPRPKPRCRRGRPPSRCHEFARGLDTPKLSPRPESCRD